MQTKLTELARHLPCLETATTAQGAGSLSHSSIESVWQATFEKNQYYKSDVRSSPVLSPGSETLQATKKHHSERLPKHGTARREYSR
jgi:hypothetical protein